MALFLLFPLTPGSVYLFCGAMGFLWLGTVPLTNGVLAGVFGVQYISTLFGTRLLRPPARRLSRNLAGRVRIRQSWVLRLRLGVLDAGWRNCRRASPPHRRQARPWKTATASHLKLFDLFRRTGVAALPGSSSANPVRSIPRWRVRQRRAGMTGRRDTNTRSASRDAKRRPANARRGPGPSPSPNVPHAGCCEG